MNTNESRDDIVRWIRYNHESLSPSQQKVAEFLLEGGINVIHLTITEIASAVGVNSSTVVRTAQALGFEGFPGIAIGLAQPVPQPGEDRPTYANWLTKADRGFIGGR